MAYSLTVSTKCEYDFDDPLQDASNRRQGIFQDIVFKSKESPGLVLERQGNWAIAN